MSMHGSIDFIPSKDGKKTVVERSTPFGSGMMVLDMKVGEFQQRLNNYEHGLLMQDENAFGCLSDGAREFLISGMTPDVWAETFGVGAI